MNQQPITKELITLSKKGTELIKLRCMTTNSGYSIYCKSEIIHQLFKKHSTGRIMNSSTWGESAGLSGFDTNKFFSDPVFDNTARNTNPDKLRKSLSYWGNAKLVLEEQYDSGLVGGVPNLSFLTCSTLNEGITISVKTPTSQASVDIFMAEAENLIKYLFNQFCANKARELKLVIEEATEEITDFEGTFTKDDIEEYNWIPKETTDDREEVIRQ